MNLTTNALTTSVNRQDAKMISGNRTSKLFVLFEFFLACLFVIVALEAIFAWAGVGEQEVTKLDDKVGFVYFPNKRFTNRKEGFSRLDFNSYGMQDKLRITSKPPNTIRIAVLGDSFVASVEVERHQNFCSILEEKLNAELSKSKYEVLNFGVGGYDPGQMYLTLKERVLDFAPDLVVLAYRPEASVLLIPEIERGYLSARPFFFVGANGSLIEDRTIQRQLLCQSTAKRMQSTGWLRENSRIWGVIGQGIEPAFAWYKSGGFFQCLNPGAKERMGGLAKVEPVHIEGSSEIHWQNTDAQKSKAIEFVWPVANSLILEMNKLCKLNNCEFAILRLPGVNGHICRIENELLEKTTSDNKIPYIDTTSLFYREQRSGNSHLFYVCHMAPNGHALMAKELYRAIRERFFRPK